MAFRLKNAKSIGAQLSRIVARELRKATGEVSGGSPRGKSVHEARKHVKKIRSVLHLLRKELGDDYEPLNERIRCAARQLSPVRDADALIATMNALKRQHGGLITSSVFRTANSVLQARRRDAYARLAKRQLADVKRRLVQSRRVVPSRIRAAATSRAVRDGVKRGYRRARQAMAEAMAARAEDVRFHAWRRRVKDHWYQMRLVEGLDAKVHGRVRRLKQLQEWLGDDHNLAVLRGVILEEPHRFGEASTVAVVLGCIDKHQAALRGRAVQRGRRLFSKEPALFRKQISRSWE